MSTISFGKRMPAFTLVELLVVIAIIAILAGMMLPALGKAKAKAQGIQCMNNFRQLTLAWLNYTHDNNEMLLFSSAPQNVPHAWVTGALDFNPDNASNFDLDKDIKKSPLWPYCGGSAAIWKCPADQSSVVPATGPSAGRRTPRVRSMSMSVWMGGFAGQLMTPYPGIQSPPWRLYRKLNDIVDPGPANTLLFWDQREDSINHGNFGISMQGFPDRPELTEFLWDLPGSYHNRAGGLSFADGHSEIRRWVDPRTTPPLLKGQAGGVTFVFTAENNRDIIWLQQRATRKPK